MTTFVVDLFDLEEDKTISVREVLTKFVYSILLIKRNWKVIIILSIISTGIGFTSHNDGPYIAPTEIFLTKDSHKLNDFVVSDSYGFKYSDSKVSKDEFGSLVKSSKIIDKILKQIITISGQKDTVFNHIIKQEVVQSNEEGIHLLGKRNIALKYLRENIRTVITTKSTITLEVLSHNEELAIKVSKLLVEKTKDLIKNIGLKTEIRFREKLIEKRDSLANQKLNNESNLISQLNIQYELSELKIARFESNIEVISLPDYPLNKKGFSLPIYSLIFTFIGLVLSSMFVLIKKIIKKNLKDIKF